MQELRARLRELAAERVRFGYRRLGGRCCGGSGTGRHAAVGGES